MEIKKKTQPLVCKNLVGYEDLARDLEKVNDQISFYKEKVKVLESQKKRLEAPFRTELEEADVGVLSGYEILYKRSTRRDFNKSRFKKDHADLYDEYCDSTPSRKFTFKKTDEMPEPEEPTFNF